MTARAVVAAVSPEGDVTLELEEAACSGCAGVCMWRRLKTRRLRGPFDGRGLAPGMTVELSVPERCIFYGSLAVYGLPLLGLLAGAGIGAVVTGSDPGVLAGAATGIVSIGLLTPSLRRRIERGVLGSVRVKPLP